MEHLERCRRVFDNKGLDAVALQDLILHDVVQGQTAWWSNTLACSATTWTGSGTRRAQLQFSFRFVFFHFFHTWCKYSLLLAESGRTPAAKNKNHLSVLEKACVGVRAQATKSETKSKRIFIYLYICIYIYNLSLISVLVLIRGTTQKATSSQQLCPGAIGKLSLPFAVTGESRNLIEISVTRRRATKATA
jgi:hypothetical protein